MYEAKFEDNTTNRNSFPAHSLSPAPAGARKQYVPSDVKFDGRTTSGEDFKGHEIETQRPSVGLWVENDRTEVLIHAGAALPSRAARVLGAGRAGRVGEMGMRAGVAAESSRPPPLPRGAGGRRGPVRRSAAQAEPGGSAARLAAPGRRAGREAAAAAGRLRCGRSPRGLSRQPSSEDHI